MIGRILESQGHTLLTIVAVYVAHLVFKSYSNFK